MRFLSPTTEAPQQMESTGMKGGACVPIKLYLQPQAVSQSRLGLESACPIMQEPPLILV